MKVLVDGTAFENRHQRGIQRYFQEVLGRLSSRHQITIWTECPPQADLPAGCAQLGPDLARKPRRWNLALRARRLMLRRTRWAGQPRHDVFFSSYYTSSPHPGLPEVVVVHDMIHEQFVETHQDAEDVIEQKRQAILNARTCIAISDVTASELTAFYPDVAGRVHTIHHGVDHLVAAARRAHGQGTQSSPLGRYVLFVGERRSYKNFTAILEAMGTRKWPEEVRLAVVGKPFTAGEQLLLEKMRVRDRIIDAGRVSDAELARWYGGAVGFLFPSLAEGFGFPSLEAQCLSTPVACSDIPIFREVCGDSALYFDPYSPESIAQSVNCLLKGAVRQSLIERGKRNVERYSWDRCAAETERVLLAAAEQGTTEAFQ